MATSRPRRRRRRCRICGELFTPDPRVGDRQRVCSRPACQEARIKETQASWRKRNPGYFIAWRATKRAEQSKSDVVDPPRVPPPLDGLPWELAQEEFGVVGADFMASLGRKLVVYAKDQSLGKVSGSTGESGKYDAGVAKDQLLAQLIEVTREYPELVSEFRKTRSGPWQDAAHDGA
jgi:hypothetical protein